MRLGEIQERFDVSWFGVLAVWEGLAGHNERYN